MRFVATDTETGGLDKKKHSLLTLHMRVLDINLEVVDQISVALKHEVYRVTAGALRVNNIDLVKHDQTAIPVDHAATMISGFLEAHSRDEKLLFMAHNAPFDKGFIDETFGEELMKPFIDYHSLDTVVLGVVEKILGTMSPKQSLSLVRIADALKLEKGEAHTASGDVTTMVNYAKDFKARYLAKLRV
jgi:DNA polymerase III alpha subunit (gram-positive type)